MATLKNEDKLKKQKEQIIVLRDQKSKLCSELNNTNKRLASRDAKCLRNKKEIKELREKVKELQKALKKGSKDLGGQSAIGMEVPKGHSYFTWIIQAAINLQVKCNQSYRQVQQSLGVLIFLMGFTLKIPCANTIRQWVHKFGKSELEKELENAQSKVLVIDESIGIGQEKVLLILGVENWAENPRNLSHEDAIVSGLQTKKSWTGVAIAEQIKKVKGAKKYVVSDSNSTLKNACKLLGLVHVPDCTHFMGNWIKNYCEKNEECVKLLGQMSKIRSQWDKRPIRV